MKCNVCNFENPPEEKDFCQKCGSPLSAQVQAPSSAPASAAPAPVEPQIPLAPAAPEVSAAPVSGAKLVIPGKGEMSLQTLPKILGREDFIKFVSPEESKYISRQEHITISFTDSKYFLQDDKSVNGTKLNGDEIKGMGSKELKSDDKITLADVLTLTFQRIN